MTPQPPSIKMLALSIFWWFTSSFILLVSANAITAATLYLLKGTFIFEKSDIIYSLKSAGCIGIFGGGGIWLRAKIFEINSRK